MLKWILAGLGLSELVYGVLTFPSMGGSPLAQEIVTWGGLVSFLNVIIGSAVIAGLLGWYADDITDFFNEFVHL